MHNDKDFCKYIFSSKKYISFPQIVEFYTGIDRNRSDALIQLSRDIKENCDLVVTKIGLKENLNPLSELRWKPTEDQIQKAKEEISSNVLKSTLPETLKDQHADANYNQIKPYNQSIQDFFEEYSLINLIQNIKASSRALRNSDYVEPEIKRSILKEILRGWEQISFILFALAPVLASKGEAELEGAIFALKGDFGDTFEKRINRVIQVNPTNVVGFFFEDIFSKKIAPLLYEQFNNEDNQLRKHHLSLLLIFTRPREWKDIIENYIISLPMNSFYLFNVLNALKTKYKYDFTNEIELKQLEYLIKMCLAKHEFKIKKPGMDKIIKINNRNLPIREPSNL